MSQITFDFNEEMNALKIFKNSELLLEFNKWIAHDPNFLECLGNLSKWEYIQSVETDIE